jgi:hypothetical protein
MNEYAPNGMEGNIWDKPIGSVTIEEGEKAPKLRLEPISRVRFEVTKPAGLETFFHQYYVLIRAYPYIAHLVARKELSMPLVNFHEERCRLFSAQWDHTRPTDAGQSKMSMGECVHFAITILFFRRSDHVSDEDKIYFQCFLETVFYDECSFLSNLIWVEIR